MPRPRSPETQIRRLRYLLKNARAALGEVVEHDAQPASYRVLSAAMATGQLTVVYDGPPRRSVVYRDAAAMRMALASMDVVGFARDVLRFIDQELAPRRRRGGR